jgi:hypothetical protein
MTTSWTDDPDPRPRLRETMRRLNDTAQRLLYDGFAVGDRVVVDGGIVFKDRCYGHIIAPSSTAGGKQWFIVLIEGSIPHGPVTMPFRASLRIDEIRHAD